jgi:hypothetical protein
MAAPKPPLYVLPHGIEVVGEYPARGKNLYWRLRIRPHPFFPDAKVVFNGIYVRRNRVVLAAKLGRALTAQEIAHHDDEDRENDAPDNLESKTHAEHNRHHKTGSKHREESKQKTAASVRLAYAEGRHAPPVIREQRGESNASAKLSWEKVREIRAATGSHQEIAARYGVSRRNIGMIKKGVTWK